LPEQLSFFALPLRCKKIIEISSIYVPKTAANPFIWPISGLLTKTTESPVFKKCDSGLRSNRQSKTWSYMCITL